MELEVSLWKQRDGPWSPAAESNRTPSLEPGSPRLQSQKDYLQTASSPTCLLL